MVIRASMLRISGALTLLSVTVVWFAAADTGSVSSILPMPNAALQGQVRDIIHEAVADIGDVLLDRALGRASLAPPPLIEESVDLATKPSETVVWVPGYWRWDPGQNEFVWKPGVWREPPPEREWRPGSWEQHEDGWERSAGYWAGAKDPDLTIVELPPPPERDEVRPAAPGKDMAWTRGHWKYANGAYAWKPGLWKKKPSDDLQWVSGRWAKKGKGHRYIPGRWDHPKSRRGFAVPPGHARKADPNYSPGKSAERGAHGRANAETKGKGKGKGGGKPK